MRPAREIAQAFIDRHVDINDTVARLDLLRDDIAAALTEREAQAYERAEKAAENAPAGHHGRERSCVVAIRKLASDARAGVSCKLVIPGTVIACGEDGNYCSDECMKKG
jgi:hypothetical protein